MKVLLALFCIIGLTMCAKSVTLTSATATMWKLNYLDIASTSTTTGWNLTISFDSGTSVATPIATSGQHIGAICIITTSNYSITAAATGLASFSIDAVSNGTNALTNAITNWGPLTLASTTSTYASDTSVTHTATTDCAFVTTAQAPTVDATNFEIKYAHTILSTTTCTNFKKLSELPWYGRCFHVAEAAGATTAAAAQVTSAATNVTASASTIAFGAAIVAGTAYLAF